MAKLTLTQALWNYMARRPFTLVFTCQEIAADVTEELGHEPSLMAVSRVMARNPYFLKTTVDGKVAFCRRLDAPG